MVSYPFSSSLDGLFSLSPSPPPNRDETPHPPLLLPHSWGRAGAESDDEEQCPGVGPHSSGRRGPPTHLVTEMWGYRAGDPTCHAGSTEGGAAARFVLRRGEAGPCGAQYKISRNIRRQGVAVDAKVDTPTSPTRGARQCPGRHGMASSLPGIFMAPQPSSSSRRRRGTEESEGNETSGLALALLSVRRSPALGLVSFGFGEEGAGVGPSFMALSGPRW